MVPKVNTPEQDAINAQLQRRRARDAAYQAMLSADRAFRAELVKAYGEACAGDMRYRLSHPTHPAVEAAGRAFVEASDVWRRLQ